MRNILITLCLIVIPHALSIYYGSLKFEEGKEFTILQLTDLHYGENEEKDRKSTILIEKLINYSQPDLVVVTGDSVSGYSWDGLNQSFYSKCWDFWTYPMRKLKVPYAYTLGNHDDQGDLNRKQIVDLDQTHPFSLTQYNPSATGATNYVVPIYSSNSTHKTPVVMLWMFDTNDETCKGMTDSWGCFEQDELEWFERQTEFYKSKLGYVPQGLSFYHIPLKEYLHVHNWGKTYRTRNEVISCPKKNTNLFKSMLKYQNINGSFVGHDHNNDSGGFFSGIELVYGRKTGYGGYGPDYFQRGGRVIKLKEKYDSQEDRMKFDYRHFIVQEDGTFIENGEATWKGYYDFVNSCSR